MARVYTIEGVRSRKKRKSRRLGDSSGPSCKRVRFGKSRSKTIELCRQSNGRWKFMKGTVR